MAPNTEGSTVEMIGVIDKETGVVTIKEIEEVVDKIGEKREDPILYPCMRGLRLMEGREWRG